MAIYGFHFAFKNPHNKQSRNQNDARAIDEDGPDLSGIRSNEDAMESHEDPGREHKEMKFFPKLKTEFFHEEIGSGHDD